MGKDKPAKAQAVPIKADGNGKASGKSQADQNPANAGRGHKQRGAGTVITARPAITTNDGIVLKPHERLPSQLLNEYCQREKRPMPKYVANPPGNRFTVNLEDSKNSKNDLSFSPNQAAESATVARDYAALLALFHFQRTLPLERKLPEPYSSTWLDMIRSAKGEVSPPPTNASQSTSKLNSTASNSSQTAAPAESKKAPATTVNLPAKLDRETADWLCDACGSQNFAKLLNGQPRVKCFRCQTPKSSTCSLVASATNAEVSEMKKKAAPKALTGLTTTSKFVSRSEAEQFQIQQRQERNRKMTFFDALKRVNRPKTIHFLVELRNKLEQLLGLQTEKSCNSSKFASSEHYHALLEEIEEEGLIAQDICEIPYSQQTSILQSVLSKLEIEEGDNSASLNNCVKVFLDKFLESFVEDFLFETSSSELSNEEIFEQLLESHLRNILAYNAKNLEISSSVPAEELSTNQIVGSYYGVLIQFLRMIGWNSNFLNSNAVQLTLQKLFPSDSIESDDTAIALAMITHAMFTFVANPNQSDGFLSSLSFLSQIKKQSQSTLAEEVEEEIAVLQSMFNDQFQMSTISVQGAGDQSQQFFLLSLEFSESYNFLKIPCKLKLRVLLTDHLGYPANLPFATLSIQEPAIIKNEKIFGMIFDLNVALFQKLSTLKGTSVLYELYSFIQGKLSEENGKRLIISSPRVDITKLEDFLTAVARGDIDDVPSLLAPVFTAKNSSAISPNINDNQSLITETESISVTPSESSKIPSTKVDKNIFGPSFWNRPKNPKPEPAVAVYPSRKSLPAWNSRDIFLQSLSDPSTRGMIVTGETGCGKTTQIPQFIAENSPSSKIVICQPRRLAAIGVATRVAEEQYSQLGDRVGYMVKGDSKVSPQTTIAFCTYGVLLRRLQDDPTLAAIDYIILDEIHERGIDSDFTLALLIDAILKRTNLKLILMSATISTGHFQQYLSRHLHRDNIPILEIPGFTYPVTEIFKGEYEEVIRNYPIKALQQSNNYDDGEDDEDYGRNKNNNMIPFRKKDIDYDLLCKLVFALIHPHETTSSVVQKATGCILIFLPGVPEINRFLQFFRTYYHRESSDDTIHLISLHGNVAPEEQLKIFHTHPRGHLKIIAATNVAEASVTIPDVTVVIDTCRVKEMDYNTDVQAYALTMKFAAKDSLRQRRGRAGRVQKGKCYRLITKGTFDKLPDHSVPEMLRLPLESILLQILSMKISLPNPNFAGAKTIIPPACDYILKKCPNTPKIENIVAALQILSSLQAIEYKPSVAEDDHSRASATTSETAKDFKILTPLGEIIARLPCHPRIGRLLIFGCLLDCVYPTLCVAATLTCRSPFTMGNDADSIEKVKQAKRKFAGSSKLKSDYNIIVNCFVAWERAKDSRRFCKNHGLIFERLIEIKQTMKDYLKDLLEIGVLSSRRYPSSYQDYLQYYEEQLQKIQDQPVQTTGASHLRYEYLLSAIYCAGLYPQVSKILHPPKRFMEVMGAAVERDAEAKEVKYYLPKNQLINPLEDSPALSLSGNTSRSVTADFDISTENLQRIFIHPSSANFSNASYTTSNYLLYGEKSIVNTVSPSPSGSNNSKGNNQEKIYIKDTSEVTAFALVLFGGSLSYDASKGLLLVDDWISFACSERIAAIFFRIREEFHRVLQRKLEVDRSEDFNLSDVPIIGVVKELLLTSFD